MVGRPKNKEPKNMTKKEICNRLMKEQEPGGNNHTGTITSIDDRKVDKIFKRERQKKIEKQREDGRLYRHKNKMAKALEKKGSSKK